MTVEQPPVIHNLVEQDGKATLPWILYFNSITSGDAGTAWSPSFTNLTEVGGSATIVGRYYQLTSNLVFFRIDVTPVTNTSATAGTTYVDNFPLQVNANGFCLSVSGDLGGSLGVVRESDGRIYVPTWTTVTSKVTVLGLVEAS